MTIFLCLLFFLFGVEVRKKGIHLGPVGKPRDDNFFMFVVLVVDAEVRKRYTPGSRGPATG